MRATAGIGADQHPSALAGGQLREREPGGLMWSAGGVGSGVAGAQNMPSASPAAPAP